MTARRICCVLLILGTLAGQISVAANAADFTCNVYGGAFLLDDSDFRAIRDSGVTKEKFDSIKPDQRDRICQSRKLWRLIKDGKAETCDFLLHYRNYNALYFDDAEADKVLIAQAKVRAEAGKKICR
jgi:hypothetical protein